MLEARCEREPNLLNEETVRRRSAASRTGMTDRPGYLKILKLRRQMINSRQCNSRQRSSETLLAVLLLSIFSLWCPTAGAIPTVNPVPFISNMSPVSVAPGGADFTLTVNGANFVNTSTVNWGSTALTTTYVSAKQLTATVTASLIASGGTGWVTVSSPVGKKSNVAYLPVVHSVPSLTLVSTSYTVGSAAYYVAEGDFNNDGNLDLISANAGNNTVSILLGNGDGTFQAATSAATGITQVYGITAGDVDGDGNLDLVIGSDGTGEIAVLLGNGDGTFQTPKTLTEGSSQPLNPVLADLNHDGKLDIIVGNNTASLSVLLGNGDGTFQAAQTTSVPGVTVFALAVSDINGDGKLDVIAGSNGGGSSMAILLGNGDGTFQTPTNLASASSGPISPVLADLDGDGKLDIAVGNYLAGTVSIFLGNGDGTFQTPTTFTVGGFDVGIAVGDVNGDGKLDVITGGPTGAAIAVSLGNGDGTFQTKQTFGPSGLGFRPILGNFATGGGLAVAIASSSGKVIVLQPTVILSPASSDFGSIGTGSPSPTQTFTLTNETANTVTVSSVSFTGTNASDFSETDTCSSPVSSGGTCTISVIFTPGATGERTASLTVTDDAGNSPQTSTLTGTGVAAPIVQLSSALISFGNQTTGTTSSSQTVTVTNNGSASLTSIVISVAGTNSSEFGETTTCGSTLAQAASCSISVTFSPATAGGKTASVQIADNAADSPEAISLVGTGVAPAPVMSLSLGTIAFGNQSIGASSNSQSITITNSGNVLLTGISISITGANASDFSKTTTCGSSLAAAASCTITVTFAPASTGAKSASISIAGNASNSPQSASLSGTGTPAADYSVTVNPATLTVQSGHSGTATFTVTPVGGYSGTVQLSCSGLPTGASCVFQPAQAVLDGSNTPATVQLTLHTTGSNGVLSSKLPFGPWGTPPDLKLVMFSVSTGFIALMLLGTLRLRRTSLRYGAGILMLAMGCAIGLGLAGCGSTKLTPVAPSVGTLAGQYSATVTAAASGGSANHAAALTITITQ
jgi:hypothetical protein